MILNTENVLRIQYLKNHFASPTSNNCLEDTSKFSYYDRDHQGSFGKIDRGSSICI